MRLYRQNDNQERVRLFKQNAACVTLELIDRPVTHHVVSGVGHEKRVINHHTFSRNYTEISYPLAQARIDVNALRDQLIAVSFDNENNQEGASCNEKRRVRVLSPLFGARAIHAFYPLSFTVLCQHQKDADQITSILRDSEIKDFQVWPGVMPDPFNANGPSIADPNHEFMVTIDLSQSIIPPEATTMAMFLTPHLCDCRDSIKGITYFKTLICIRFDSRPAINDFIFYINHDPSLDGYRLEIQKLGVDTYQLNIHFKIPQGVNSQSTCAVLSDRATV